MIEYTPETYLDDWGRFALTLDEQALAEAAKRNASLGRDVPEDQQEAAKKLDRLKERVGGENGFISSAVTAEAIAAGEDAMVARYNDLSEFLPALWKSGSILVNQLAREERLTLGGGKVITKREELGESSVGTWHFAAEIERHIAEQKAALSNAISVARGVKTISELTAGAKEGAERARAQTTEAIASKDTARMRKTKEDIAPIAEALVTQDVAVEARMKRVTEGEVGALTTWIMDRLKAQHDRLLAGVREVRECSFDLTYASMTQEAQEKGSVAVGLNGAMRQDEERVSTLYRVQRQKEAGKQRAAR